VADPSETAPIGGLPPGAAEVPVPDPCLLVIFGASGDLTRRKLVPALFGLHREKLLPAGFSVLGVSRTPHTDDSFRALLAEGAREELGSGFDAAVWETFAPRLFYHPSDLLDRAGYPALRDRVRSVCALRGIPGNLLFYLAIAPKHYGSAVLGIGAAGLSAAEEAVPGFRRIVIEKPFGDDLASAKRLSTEVSSVFREEQVFRIDHYLGKETVQNLLVFRFGNGIFEPLWNRNYIDHVQITAAERIGVGSRGDYYDGAGAVRDMLQNHLLQLLALVAMEPPISLSADDVRDEKLKLLRSVEPIPADRVGEACVRGQYAAGTVRGEAVPAYRQEKDVPPGSLTETYVAARFTIDNWRWGGVPFYLRSGKRLAGRSSEIAIRFRPAPYRLFEDTACGQMESNLLVLNIQPDEGIYLQIGAKFPGPSICVQPVDFRFSYEQSFGAKSKPAYGRLLLDAMLGDPALFPREDFVLVSWALLDPFLTRWRENPGRDLYFYPAGSWGPREADTLLAREGRRWRTP
jgi:glucose-6-phosphate 1-dehydrogenase